MEPYAWTLLGLGLDIVGAFLLSVEAIKLENIRAVRDRLAREAAEPSFHLIGLIGWTLISAVIFGLFWVSFLQPELDPFVGPFWTIVERNAFFTFVVGLVLQFLLFIVAFGVAALSLKVFARLISDGLQQLDRHTPKGTIGLIGFLLLFTGFALQGVGAWAGR